MVVGRGSCFTSIVSGRWLKSLWNDSISKGMKVGSVLDGHAVILNIWRNFFILNNNFIWFKKNCFLLNMVWSRQIKKNSCAIPKDALGHSWIYKQHVQNCTNMWRRYIHYFNMKQLIQCVIIFTPSIPFFLVILVFYFFPKTIIV